MATSVCAYQPIPIHSPLLFFSFACSSCQLLEIGHRDLAAQNSQIAPLQSAIDELLNSSDLDVATRGEVMQQQCNKLLDELKAAALQVQPPALPSGGSLVGSLQLQLLDSAILESSHAADMHRFFGDISLVSTHRSQSRCVCRRAFGSILTSLISPCCCCDQGHARLLYRATRDGFEAEDFWRCCAGKGPTLTLVKVSQPQQCTVRQLSE